MKTNKYYILGGMIAATAALASCSNSDMADENATNGGNALATISATIAKADNTSRVEMSDNGAGSGIAATWSDVDKIKVVDNSNSNAAGIFALASGGNTALGHFSGTIDGLAAGHQLYAFYPSTLSLSGATATVDYSSQVGLLNTDHGVAKKAVMYAAGPLGNNGTANLTFTNATSLLRLNLTFPSQLNIKNVTLSGTGLLKSNTLTPTATGGATWGAGTTGDITATLGGTTGVATATDGTSTVYMAVLPQSLTSGLKISATATDGKTYLYNTTNQSISFIAGDVHNVTAGMNTQECIDWINSGTIATTEKGGLSNIPVTAGKTYKITINYTTAPTSNPIHVTNTVYAIISSATEASVYMLDDNNHQVSVYTYTYSNGKLSFPSTDFMDPSSGSCSDMSSLCPISTYQSAMYYECARTCYTAYLSKIEIDGANCHQSFK